jgi:HD-GYP domain-containing protein (c-di-GMP phosphodiesterase class II)
MDETNKGIEFHRDDQMTEVSKDFIVEGITLPVSIYLKLKPGSYLVVGRIGDKPDFTELKAFQSEKAIPFVKHQDHPTLIGFISQLAQKLVERKDIPDAMKIKFMSALTSDALESFEKSGFSSVAKVQVVSKMVLQMSQTVSCFSDVAHILSSLPRNESFHSMTTCLTSMLIADEMNMTMPAAREKLAIGALVHDVGIKFVPDTILKKPKHIWSPDEMAVYESHPLKGMEVLRDVKDLPMEVLLIVAEHHENAIGTGFPKKMRDIKMSPLSRIVSLSQYFSSLLFHPGEGRSFTPDEAVTYIEEVLGQPFNKPAFLALKNINNKQALAKKIA